MLGRRRVLMLVVTLSVVCAACSTGSTATPTPTLASNQMLTFPIQSDLSSLDPAVIDTEAESQLAHNVFDGLLKFDAGMNVVPDIASAMPTISNDGLTYTFKLRQDVTFSNGDKVSSKDVLYSWNRAAAMQGPYAANLSAIAGYDKVSGNQVGGAALETLLEKKDPTVTMTGLSASDDSTLVVTLARPAGWFESAIAQPASVASVVDQKVVKDDFDNWSSKPETVVGTGPFKMSAHTASQSMDFAPVPGWWGKPKPTLTKVHVVVVGDRDAALTQYEQGSLDLFGYAGYSPTVAGVQRLQSAAATKSQVVVNVRNKTYWVTFNMVADASRRAAGPFTLDQGKAAHDLREAFALAIDRTKLAKDLCGDIICVPATGGVIPKGLAGYLGDNADPLGEYDRGKARSLLLSGDPNGTKTAKGLAYAYDPENPFNEPAAKFLQAQWQANLGVSVDLVAVQRAQFLRNRLKGDYVLSRDGWSTDYNHPQDWFDNLWGSAAGCPDVTCSSGYATKAYDTLLARADGEPLTSAIADYNALSHQLIDDVVYVPLFYTASPLVIKPYVQGAGANNLFDYYWDQVQIVSH